MSQAHSTISSSLAEATLAYHVANVPSHLPQPTWFFLRYSVAGDRYYDDPLRYSAGVFFTTSFSNRNSHSVGQLPDVSVYPRHDSGGAFWRVKVPLTEFNNIDMSLGCAVPGQVLLLLTNDDAVTERFRRHPEISELDYTNNAYLCQPREREWRANVYAEDGNFVNFMIPTETVLLCDEAQWDVVDHRNMRSVIRSNQWHLDDWGSAAAHNRYWFRRHGI